MVTALARVPASDSLIDHHLWDDFWLYLRFRTNSFRPLRTGNSRTSKATFERCVVFAFKVDNLLILTGFSEEKTIIIA